MLDCPLDAVLPFVQHDHTRLSHQRLISLGEYELGERITLDSTGQVYQFLEATFLHEWADKKLSSSILR